MTELIKDIVLFLVAGVTLALLFTVIVSFFFARVPYVPSKINLVEMALRELPILPKQNFFDLGAGDGRILFLAEKHGLSPQGYEIARSRFSLGK